MQNNLGHIRAKITTAFTLVEMLVVIAIIGLLTTMLIPMITASSDINDRNNTAKTMVTTENAIRLINIQLNFSMTSCWLDSDAASNWGNHLFYRLAHNPDSAETLTLKTDMKTKIDAIPTVYPISHIDAYKLSSYTGAWTKATYDNEPYGKALASWQIGNRRKYWTGLVPQLMKREAMLYKASAYCNQQVDASDYNKESIGTHTDERGVERACILDSWGQPIIFVNKNDPGVRQIRYWGSASQTSPYTYLSATDPGHNKKGRSPIIDANTDGNLQDDIDSSDIRTTSFAGFEYEFELWSAGEDRLFNPIRGSDDNTDNFTHHSGKYQEQ